VAERQLKRLTAEISAELVSVHGISRVVAAGLIGHAGDLRNYRNAGAFAAKCGAAPVPCSSGRRVAVRVNRGGDRLRPVVPIAGVVSLLGMSGRLARPLGGHLAYAVSISVAFGLLWAVAIWSELGYSYDRFGQLAWILSPPTGLSATAVLLLALWINVKATRAGTSRGLWYAGTVVLVGLSAVVAVNMVPLPEERTIQASFETRTASAGLFKDALVLFAPLLIFILPPFHTVVRLQRELTVGAHERVRALLTRQPDAVWPPG
jgi:hypothetical protein